MRPGMSAAPALRHDGVLAILRQIGEAALRLQVLRDGPHGHANDVRRRGAAVAVAPFAVAAVLRNVVLLVLEVEQGGQALCGFQDDVAAIAPVAAVGPAMWDVLLSAEAPAPVPAVPRLHVNLALINKIHRISIPSPLEGEG